VRPPPAPRVDRVLFKRPAGRTGCDQERRALTPTDRSPPPSPCPCQPQKPPSRSSRHNHRDICGLRRRRTLPCTTVGAALVSGKGLGDRSHHYVWASAIQPWRVQPASTLIRSVATPLPIVRADPSPIPPGCENPTAARQAQPPRGGGGGGRGGRRRRRRRRRAAAAAQPPVVQVALGPTGGYELGDGAPILSVCRRAAGPSDHRRRHPRQGKNKVCFDFKDACGHQTGAWVLCPVAEGVECEAGWGAGGARSARIVGDAPAVEKGMGEQRAGQGRYTGCGCCGERATVSPWGPRR